MSTHILVLSPLPLDVPRALNEQTDPVELVFLPDQGLRDPGYNIHIYMYR